MYGNIIIQLNIVFIITEIKLKSKVFCLRNVIEWHDFFCFFNTVSLFQISRRNPCCITSCHTFNFFLFFIIFIIFFIFFFAFSYFFLCFAYTAAFFFGRTAVFIRTTTKC
ncbi:MAG: hypothetical protein E7510_06785 [Ruminococcus sp.]|nr:hypothetical protein [Ruminococcus sp.]